LGAHEHEVFDEKYDSGSVVIKAGMDAENVYIVDIVWHSKESEKPEISHKLVKVAGSKPDPDVFAEVQKYHNVVKALEVAVLYVHPEPFSSKEMRFHQTTFGTIVCNIIREELKSDAVALDSGSFRAEADYPNGKFRYSDLKNELPYGSEIAVIEVPGKILSEFIKQSRLNEGKEYNGYFQVDDGVSVDPKTHEVTHILGKPLVPDQLYKLAIYESTIHGMNNHTPIIEWFSNRPKPPVGQGMPPKEILIRNFCKRIWKKLPNFDDIDTDKNNFLSHEEIYNAYLKAFGDANGDNIIDDIEIEATKILVEHLLQTLDANQDNQISREEYYSLISN